MRLELPKVKTTGNGECFSICRCLREKELGTNEEPTMQPTWLECRQQWERVGQPPQDGITTLILVVLVMIFLLYPKKTIA